MSRIATYASRVAARLRTGLANWQEEPWELKPWSEMGSGYRAWIIASRSLQLVAIAAILVVIGVPEYEKGAWFALGAIVLSIVMSYRSLRAGSDSGLAVYQAAAQGIALAGAPLLAASCAVVGVVMQMSKKPVVLHLALSNVIDSAARMVIGGAAFEAVRDGASMLSAQGLTAFLCFFLVVNVLAGLVEMTLYIGKYIEGAVAWAGWRDATRTDFTTIAPVIMLVALVVSEPNSWFVFALMIPYAIDHQISRRTDEIVSERLRASFLRSSFERYVPASMVGVLVDSGAEAELGGRELEVTVLFCDIRGFTAWSETLEARQVVSELNLLLADLAHAVFESGGTLDKFTGDGLMAFWGAPLDQPDHADRAVLAARRMVELLSSRNEERQRLGQPALAIGIGINSGLAVVGNVGHPERHDYTVIGDTVNTAARLEAQTKELGYTTVLSRATALLLSPFLARQCHELRAVQVKGRREAVSTYGLSEHPLDGFDVEEPWAA